MNIKQHFSKHIFLFIIVLCIIITVIVSFYRFIVKNDYMVYYEGTCDPYMQSCFESCDGECTYYMKVQKYAPDIYAQCGKDITNCESANICLSNDRKCSITYCDPTIEESCEKISGVVPLEDKQNTIKESI